MDRTPADDDSGTRGGGERDRGARAGGKRQAALAGLLTVAAAAPVLFGLSLVSYAVGSPDSPRLYVGLIAVTVLGLAAVPLYAAGRLLAASGRRLPRALPVLGALAVLPLIVVSAPRDYDDGTAMPALLLGTAGVVAAGTASSARAPRLALQLGTGALASFYVVCLLLDAASLLPGPSGGPPELPPGTDPGPMPVLPAPPPPR